MAEVKGHGTFHIVQDAYHPYNRRGIDAFAQRLVVEADIAAGDWSLQGFTGLGQAIDDLRELPHDLRLFRVAEVEAIGGSHRNGTGTRDIAGSLGDGMHGPQL